MSGPWLVAMKEPAVSKCSYSKETLKRHLEVTQASLGEPTREPFLSGKPAMWSYTAARSRATVWPTRLLPL